MIEDYKGLHKGDTALIIGNGPSLDKIPDKFLSKYVSFGANKIFKRFMPDYLTCVDLLMCRDIIEELDFNHNSIKGACFVDSSCAFSGSEPLNVLIDLGFSYNPAEFVYLGGTVTYVNMQLAYYMGFSRVFLIGVDHSYPKYGNGKPGGKFLALGNDPDHFTLPDGSPYFTPQTIYNRPQLDDIQNMVFPLAKRAFELAKGEIINLTPGSKLTTFKKDDWERW